jgi:hypothetical protein
MRVSEVLHKSADILESRAWTRGNGWEWQNDYAPVCLEGGIAAAMGTVLVRYASDGLVRLSFDQEQYDRFKSCPAYQAVKEYLGDGRIPVTGVGRRQGRYLYTFNDAVAHGKDEVVAVLRAAAEVEAVKEAAEVAEEVPA